MTIRLERQARLVELNPVFELGAAQRLLGR
jgi:hypothetical protein